MENPLLGYSFLWGPGMRSLISSVKVLNSIISTVKVLNSSLFQNKVYLQPCRLIFSVKSTYNPGHNLLKGKC